MDGEDEDAFIGALQGFEAFEVAVDDGRRGGGSGSGARRGLSDMAFPSGCIR